MSKKRRNRDFGGPTGLDWAGLGIGAAYTGYQATKIYKKSRLAADRRRSYEEQYDSRDVVTDYDRGYYLRDGSW